MTKIQFLEKYNKLLILLQSNEDEEPNENQESFTDNIKKANYFNANKIKFKGNLFSNKNILRDFSIENININNVRDLIKNRNDLNNNINENLIIENNHSEIFEYSNKHTQNNEEISILEAGNLLKEINFTDSGSSTFKEKFENKFGSIIKPTNTFNNRIANNIEYQIDLEKAKIKQRIKDGNNFNMSLGSRQPSFNNIVSIMNYKNFKLNYFDNKFKKNDLINDLKRDVRKEIFLGNSKNKYTEKNEIDLDNHINHNNLIQENINDLPDLNIEDNTKENKELINKEINTQSNFFACEPEMSKTPNKININFTNYGVINNNLINYNIPKSNRLNNKMLDILKEITLTNTKQPKTSIYDSQNINIKTKLTTNDLNKNNIMDSILNNNLNNIQNSLNKNYIEMNSKNNDNNNINFRNIIINNKKELNNNGNDNDNITSLANKIEYFSDLFRSVDNKKSTKSLIERINQLKKKNNFLESGIKGVNNTNNIFNMNLKLSNMDKVFRNNNFIMNSNNFYMNRADSQIYKRNNTNNSPKIKRKLIKNNNQQYEHSNLNNFYVLEAQLDSLKNKSTKFNMNYSKINRVSSESINFNMNNLKNSKEKNKYLNQNINEIEDCNILRNNHKKYLSEKFKHSEIYENEEKNIIV